jgi:SM-20-related protein
MRRTFSAKHLSVQDALVPTSLKRRLEELMMLPIWAYGWKSNQARDRFSFWHAHFAGGDSKSRRNCETELDAADELQPIRQLWKILKRGPLRGHEPLRIYANAHTFGVEGQPHTDNKDRENYFSTVYYAHPRWEARWAGETVFYGESAEDIVASVYPKPGRLVTFPGAMMHCARAPARECPELRVTLVIKTHRTRK